MSVGFLPLGEIQNPIVDLLDEEPTRTFLSDTQICEIFSDIFIIHGFWLLPQKCGTFSIYQPECEQQIFAQGWNSSWKRRTRRGRANFWLAIRFLKVQEKVSKYTVNRKQAGEMPPRQRRKWRTVKSQMEALKISPTSGNRSLMNYLENCFICFLIYVNDFPIIILFIVFFFKKSLELWDSIFNS